MSHTVQASSSSTKKPLYRETPYIFSTDPNALNDQAGDLNKSKMNRSKGSSKGVTSSSPPHTFYSSMPTVSFDHSLPSSSSPPSTSFSKRSSTVSMPSSSKATATTTTTTLHGEDLKKKNASGKHVYKRKSSASSTLLTEPSCSKKPKAATTTVGSAASTGVVPVAAAAAHAQYPYGPYPAYPYYYHPYYPAPPGNVVPPPPGYTWPYPVVPHAYPHPYYAPYYPPSHPHAPAAVASNPHVAALPKSRDDKSKGVKSAKARTAGAGLKEAAPDAVPSCSTTTMVRQKAKVSSNQARLSVSLPPTVKSEMFPPRDITIHNFMDGIDADDQDCCPRDSNDLSRRERKNAQSRRRAARLKQMIHIIKSKRPEDRTKDEVAKLEIYEERRRRKNGRSRERAMERKVRFEEISAKPHSEWTQEERAFMEETLTAKYKKNEGDRLRRKKMRESGSSSHGSVSVASYTPLSLEFPSRYLEGHGRAVAGDVAASSLKSVLVPKVTAAAAAVSHAACGSGGGSDRGTTSAPPQTPKNDMELYNDDDGFARIFDISPTRRDECDEKDIMSHFIFPSPSDDDDRLIHSPTLELCAETSILDQNLEDIILSPHLTTPRITVSADDGAADEIQGIQSSSLSSRGTSPLTLRLLDLPRRTKPDENLYDEAFCSDWRGFRELDDNYNQHEPIAVSFSMDTI